jgi:hypothetical protein
MEQSGLDVFFIPYLYTKNDSPRLVKSRSEAEVDFIFLGFLTADYLKRHYDWLKIEEI